MMKNVRFFFGRKDDLTISKGRGIMENTGILMVIGGVHINLV